MAGWINDYKMDYSPVVNALNAKYKDRADQRAFLTSIFNTVGQTAGNMLDSYQRSKSLDALKDKEVDRLYQSFSRQYPNVSKEEFIKVYYDMGA